MQLLETVLDLVVPQECAGCRQPGSRWCAACVAALATAASHPLGRAAPTPTPAGFPRTVAAAAYSGPVRGALLAYKERGVLGLRQPLGRALAAAVQVLALDEPVVLVPVPSAPRVVRTRGHDAGRGLAREAARLLGLPCAPLLRQARRVRDQAGLDTGQRADNLRGALAVRRCPAGLALVVVDDVVTSGASLTEASRVLTAAGGRVLGAATVAATQRRSAGQTTT